MNALTNERKTRISV